MEPEIFLLEMYESDECQKILYKRLAIHMYIGLYCAMKPERGVIDSFMIPFRDYVKCQIVNTEINVDELLKYMIENDESNCALFSVATMFRHKEGITSDEFYNAITKYKVVTPFADIIDMDVFSLIVVSFVLDNLYPRNVNIGSIIGKEQFIYPTNQYNLTRINGADFRKDGLIFDGKGYFYNYFTNRTMLDQYDSMIGFARIISDEKEDFDILYRLDEQLAIPKDEYYDYTGVSYARCRGPQFHFNRKNLEDSKTIVVHIDENTTDKLLMVIKKKNDENTGEDFLHIEIETLPHKESVEKEVITTFLHGIYYPSKDIFTHIDYAKNQYSGAVYLQKYADSHTGITIDQYTETRDLHYKIWCIENGEFSRETWYKLMIISLPELYQRLLNEILE